jgi:hypothetical protein
LAPDLLFLGLRDLVVDRFRGLGARWVLFARIWPGRDDRSGVGVVFGRGWSWMHSRRFCGGVLVARPGGISRPGPGTPTVIPPVVVSGFVSVSRPRLSGVCVGVGAHIVIFGLFERGPAICAPMAEGSVWSMPLRLSRAPVRRCLEPFLAERGFLTVIRRSR